MYDERDNIYSQRLRPLLQGTTAKPWEKVKERKENGFPKSLMKGSKT